MFLERARKPSLLDLLQVQLEVPYYNVLCF